MICIKSMSIGFNKYMTRLFCNFDSLFESILKHLSFHHPTAGVFEIQPITDLASFTDKGTSTTPTNLDKLELFYDNVSIHLKFDFPVSPALL